MVNKTKSKINESWERLGRAILHLGLDNTSIENKMIQPHKLKTESKTEKSQLSSAR